MNEKDNTLNAAKVAIEAGLEAATREIDRLTLRVSELELEQGQVNRPLLVARVRLSEVVGRLHRAEYSTAMQLETTLEGILTQLNLACLPDDIRTRRFNPERPSVVMGTEKKNAAGFGQPEASAPKTMGLANDAVRKQRAEAAAGADVPRGLHMANYARERREKTMSIAAAANRLGREAIAGDSSDVARLVQELAEVVLTTLPA